MRHRHYNPTPAAVRKPTLRPLCQKHLRCLRPRPQVFTAGMLWVVLFYAASRLISLAAACCRAARPAPVRHRLPRMPSPAYVLARPGPSATTRQSRSSKVTCPRPCGVAASAVGDPDLTLIPYHGLPLHHTDEVYRSQAKSGTTHFHAYATAYVIRKGLRFTVALTPVYAGANPLQEGDRVGCSARQPTRACDRGICCWIVGFAASRWSATCRCTRYART